MNELATTTSVSSDSDSLVRPLWFLVSLELAGLLLCQALAIRNRYFVNDDYQLLYTSWLRSQGQQPIADYGVQSYHILPDLIAPLFNLFGAEIETAFAIRWLFLVALAIIPCLVVKLSGRLLPPLWSPIAALFALCNWPLIERGLDMRPDTFTAILWMTALLLVTKPNVTKQTLVWLGVTLACSVIIRIKAVLILPSLVVLLFLRRDSLLWTKRNFNDTARDLVWMGLGGALIFSAFLSYLWLTSQWDYFMSAQASLAKISMGDSQEKGLRARAFSNLWETDAALIIAFVLGIATLPLLPRRDRTLGYILFFFLATAVASNSAFYSYNFVALLPLAAPLATLGFATFTSRWPRFQGFAALILAIAIPIRHAELLYGLTMTSTNQHQLLLAECLARTAPDTTVFALEGLGLFRPSLHDFRLSAVARPLADAGIIDLERQLRESAPEIIILSYRIPAWLPAKAQHWIKDHYAQAGDYFLLREEVATPHRGSSIYVPRTATYRVGSAPCRVSATVHAAHAQVRLERGFYLLQAAGSQNCHLRFDWPEARLVAPNKAPYLISPDWRFYESQ